MIDRRLSQNEDNFIKQDLEQMARARNYLNYQFQMFEKFLGKRVIEVGSGIGNLTEKIIPNAELMVALEPNKFCYELLKSKLGKHESLILLNSQIEEYSIEKFKEYFLDTVLCINVLEHIKDDFSVMQKFSKMLVNSGHLILIVPSLGWAYGVIDRCVGHYRRYSLNQITALVRNTGLKVKYSRYFNPIGLLGWLWNGKITKKMQQSDTQIYIFDKFVIPWQGFIEKIIKLPIGQSCLLVAGKR